MSRPRYPSDGATFARILHDHIQSLGSDNDLVATWTRLRDLIYQDPNARKTGIINLGSARRMEVTGKRRQDASDRTLARCLANVGATFAQHNRDVWTITDHKHPKSLRMASGKSVEKLPYRDLDLDRDKEKRRKKSIAPDGGNGVVPMRVRIVEWIEEWNGLAERLGLPGVRPPLSKKRAGALGERIREMDEREETWGDIWKKIEESPFLQGENKRGWKVGIKYLVQPDGPGDILSGTFGKRGETGSGRAAKGFFVSGHSVGASRRSGR